MAKKTTFTTREWEVFQGLRAAKTNKTIALELGLSEKTVKAHCTSVMRKCGCKTRSQVAIMRTLDYAHLTEGIKDGPVESRRHQCLEASDPSLPVPQL